MSYCSSYHSRDHARRLYTFAHRGPVRNKITGYTGLGFDVCFRRVQALARELQRPSPKAKPGTIRLLKEYDELLSIARRKHERTGWRSTSELTPQLVGLEGKRVRVVDCYDDVRTFRVGKSTGFIPIHLEVEPGEDGGGAVTGAPFKLIEVLP